MSRLPEALSFMRPSIHRLRLALRQIPFFRFLYQQTKPQPSDQDWRTAYDGIRVQYLNLLDRFAVLESSLNWRLHGLPARIENIRLEQAPILSSLGLVGEAVDCLASNNPEPSVLIGEAFDSLPRGAVVFAVKAQYSNVFGLLKEKSPAKLLSVADPTDLFNNSKTPSDIDFDQTEQKVIATLLDAAARFTRPEFDLIWMDSAIERLTPIQAQTFFLAARKGLTKQGRCLGYFADFSRSDAGIYWGDPRRIRPITKPIIKQFADNAGFSETLFSESLTANGIMYVFFDIS